MCAFPEDGPAEYVAGSREHFRLAAGSASAALAQDLRALGRLREALEAARTSVRLDRYQDLAWQLLIDLHQAAGDSSAAARTRREHTRVHAELEDTDAEHISSGSREGSDREFWRRVTAAETA